MLKAISASAAAAFACLLVAAPASAASLLDVRFGPNAEKTRLVIDLSAAPDYVISGDDAGQGRIIIEFSGLDVAAEKRRLSKGQGHFASYQFTPLDGKTVRAVFDLGKTARIAEAFMLAPKGAVNNHRFVIDVETASKQAFLDSLPQKYIDLSAIIEKATAGAAGQAVVLEKPADIAISAPKAAPAPSLAPVAPLVERKIVVIDAGHGGADPGAQGQNGTLEKTVTLAAALELEKILKKTGRYDVVLVRNRDIKVRPDKRETLARKAGADLFISLHADAIAQPGVRGASVYTLSEQGSQRTVKQAREQGNYHVYGLDVAEYGQEVGGLLFDLAQRRTNNASSFFAEALIKNLNGKTPMLNKSHRTGDLRVLLAPDVPAVLLEMAFISNARDEANLNSPKWRKKTMTAVAKAIDQYFEEDALARHASNRAGSVR